METANKIDVNAVNAKTEIDSNKLGSPIQQVCSPCGITANVLTCLKKYGNRPDKLCFSVSTFHEGVCDYCKETRDVTQTRDFFYPDFSLIEKAAKRLG